MNASLMILEIAQLQIKPGETAEFETAFSDYKDFGGVKLPTTIKFAVPNISWTRKIVEVKNNVTVDDAKFGK